MARDRRWGRWTFARRLGVVLCALALACLLPLRLAQAQAQTPPFSASKALEAIRQKGEIAVGVKTDFPPFGMLDSAGRPIGLEIDLARKLADALGVKLRTVGVTTENRFQRLEQGAVDLIIATAGDTRERRELATAIEPSYYGAGVSVMLRPEETAADWPGVRGKTLCALQGAYFNKTIAQRYILTLQIYGNVRDALLALRDKRCVGFLYTDVTIQEYLKQPEWEGFRAPFPSALVIPWAIFLARSEGGSEFERIVGDLVAQWHREGALIAIEKNWGIRPSKFLQDAQILWSRKDDSGRYLCERNEKGLWPLSCRNPAFITSAEVQGMRGFGLWLKETLGLDLSIVYDPYDSERYLRGIGYTILLSGFSILGALILGYLGASLILAHVFFVSPLVRVVANYGRMTPPLLQMYLIFFGLGGFLESREGIAVSPFAVAVWCLSFYHGAMIMFAMLEAAHVVKIAEPGFRMSVARLPALLRLSSIGVRSALSNLTKSTSIASAIAVPELLSSTISIMGDQGNVGVMMSLLLIVFYILSTVWLFVIVRAERAIVGLEARR